AARGPCRRRVVGRGVFTLVPAVAAAALTSAGRGQRRGRLRLDVLGRGGLEVAGQEKGEDAVAMLVLRDPPGDGSELREVVERQGLPLGGEPGADAPHLARRDL